MQRLYEAYIQRFDDAYLNRTAVVYDDFERIISYTPFQDTIIPVVLNRNPQWTNKLLVVDVTSSMTPYAEQVKLWYRRHNQLQNQTQFVLFNDGNDKQNSLKTIENTGGIYYCPFCPYPTFMDTQKKPRRVGRVKLIAVRL
jgi:hypothetical protein